MSALLVTRDYINVCYGPYHNAQAKTWGDYTPYDIEMDIRILAEHFSCIRTYSCAYHSALIPSIAAKYNVNVVMGIDVEKGDLTANQSIIDAAVKIANDNRNVIAILVGNENIYPGAQTAVSLVTMIDYIRPKVGAAWSSARLKMGRVVRRRAGFSGVRCD